MASTTTTTSSSTSPPAPASALERARLWLASKLLSRPAPQLLPAATTDTGIVRNGRTGLGVGGRDRMEDLEISLPPTLDRETLTRMWRKSALVRRIVQKRAQVALSRGVSLSVERGDPAWLRSEMRRLGALQRALEGRAWGGLYGGGLVVATIEGAGLPSEPLDLRRVRRVVRLRVFDRHQVVRVNWDSGLADPARTGEVLSYLVQPPSGGQITEYHHSRVFRFGGAPTPEREMIQQQCWDDSVLMGPYSSLLRMWAGAQQLATQLSDASVGVWKISGLNDWIAGGNARAVQDWIDTQILYRGVLGDHALDASDAFDFKGRPLDDSVEVFRALMLEFASEVDMPFTELFGISPSSLNASEQSDLEKWREQVNSYERPIFEDFLGWLLPVLQSQVSTPPDLRGVRVEVSWPALGGVTPKEEAEIELLRAQTEDILVNKIGSLQKEEARARLRKSSLYLIDADQADDDGDEVPEVDADTAFKPTAAMASAARLGLELRQTFGRGGTAVGVARANQYAAREGVSAQTVVRTYRFFERFKGERGRESGTGKWADRERPSNAWIAWLLWGGDPGWRWARGIVEREGLVGEDAALDAAGAAVDDALGMEPARSLWVGFRLPPELGAGEDPAHVTLLTFDPSTLSAEGLLEEVVRPLALTHGAGGRATLEGLGHLVGPSGRLVVYQRVDFDREGRLDSLRDALVEALQGRGLKVPFGDGWWRPHRTLAYLEKPTDTYAGPVVAGSWWAGELEVWEWDGHENRVVGKVALGL